MPADPPVRIPHPFPHPEAVVSIRMKHRLNCNGVFASFETFWENANPSLMADVPGMQALVDGIDDGLGSLWALMADTEATWLNTTGVFYAGVNQQDFTSTNDPHPGMLSALTNPNTDTLPPNTALVIQRRTGIAGRNNRGRVFIPFISEALQAKGYLEDGASRAQAAAFASYMAANHTTLTYTIAARHWDRKNDRLEVVTSCRYVDGFRTRTDRMPYREVIAR